MKICKGELQYKNMRGRIAIRPYRLFIEGTKVEFIVF